MPTATTAKDLQRLAEALDCSLLDLEIHIETAVMDGLPAPVLAAAALELEKARRAIEAAAGGIEQGKAAARAARLARAKRLATATAAAK